MSRAWGDFVVVCLKRKRPRLNEASAQRKKSSAVAGRDNADINNLSIEFAICSAHKKHYLLVFGAKHRATL